MRSADPVAALAAQAQNKGFEPATRAALDQVRSLIADIENKNQKYREEVEPIDWDHYRSIIKTPGLVDAFEADYKSMEFPTVDAEQFANADEGEFDKSIADAAGSVEESKARVAELEELLALMKATRTDENTKIEDLQQLYPEVTEAIDDEIANYQFDKDI